MDEMNNNKNNNKMNNDDEEEDHHHLQQQQQQQQQQEEHALVECETSVGLITFHFHRSWSPRGYDRAVTLFERGYYDHSHFFRVVPHFLVQFGISYTTDVELQKLANTPILDDDPPPPIQDKPHEEATNRVNNNNNNNDRLLLPSLPLFQEGRISFAGSGPNSRTSQLFIAYENAGSLGNSPWETPLGEVKKYDMDNVVRKLYSGYGDMPPWGHGPEQGPIRNIGEAYIAENFPLLDKFEKCTVTRSDDAFISLEEKEKEVNNALVEKEEKEEENLPVENVSRKTIDNDDAVDDPAGAGEGLPQEINVLQHRGGTRGGSFSQLQMNKLSNVVLSLSEHHTRNYLFVFGSLSFTMMVVFLVIAIVYCYFRCTSRRRKRGMTQLQKSA